MDLKEYKMNTELEEAGAVVEIDDETTITVSRFNNSKFRSMQERLSEPYQKRAGRSDITEDQADEILCQCMAKHLLLKWTGLTLYGELVEYSEAKCYEILRDPTLKDFKELVLLESQKLDHFREERLEEDLKNLEKISTTKAGGRNRSKNSSKQ